MKIFTIMLINVCWFIFSSNILAQVETNIRDSTPSDTITKTTLIEAPQQNWDIVFNDNISSIIGESGNAGVVYEPIFSEIWISKWAIDTLATLIVSDTSVALTYKFSIPGITGIRGMTSDGTYIYAGTNTDTIKIIDPLDYQQKGEIITTEIVRYISYDPQADSGNGGFWVGNFSTNPTLIDRNGNTIRSLDMSSIGLSSVYGGVYDNFSANGPFLWLWSQGLGAGNPQYIVQIDPSSGIPTGIQHDVMADVGIAQDSSVAGGLFITDQLIEGKIILGGILQGTPDLLFGYDIGSSIIITTPPTATTGSATSISTTTAVLNGTINPNGSNTTYSFEYGTTTSYGDTASGTQELTGSSDQNVNAPITDLTPNTLYHYRLSATNSGGSTDGNDATFTTTSSTSTVDLEWRTLGISTFNWIAGNSISAELKVVNNGNSTASPQSTQLYLSVDNSIEQSDTPLGNLMNFGSIPGGDSLTLTTSFTVPSVNAGIYFVGAFVDVNNVIAESNENNNNYVRAGKVIVDYPSNIQLSNTLNFNDPAQSSSYRMIGIPGNSNTPIAQIFSGTSGKDWTAFYDNGNTSDYLVSYTSTNTFNFTPGKGFWVLSKNPLNINQNANSVVLENDKVSIGTFELGFPIPLHSGWNIISNPFETSIVWSQVKSFNAVSEDIHSFNGSFTTSSNLDPYKGYYFFNVGNLSSLFIPYSPNSGIGKTSLKNNSLADNITISLLGEGNIKANISIGNNEESNIGYDKFDRFAPPIDFEDYSISILNNKLEIPYKNLLVDSRANLTNQNYDLQIKWPIHKNFELEMDAPENIENLNIYIFDQHSNFHNMKVEKHIILKSYSKVNNLQLLIGDNSFIEKQKSTLLPKEFKLSQNYPNPFNPTTVIQYSIPKTSEVELNIYDLLGNKVETLVNKEQTAGVYNYEFNASKLASGVYFYRIKAGNFVQTKKFVLMK